MTITRIQREQRSTRRTVATIFASGAVAISMVLGGAAPAQAAWVSPIGATHHKPKSWICSTFNICKSTAHYYCGNPNIAYTKPQPCRYLHTDRY